jgi:hypothetical protein
VEDLGVDGRILKLIKKWMGRGMDWIDKAQDNDMLLALVNAVMNLRVPKCVEFLVCLRTY